MHNTAFIVPFVLARKRNKLPFLQALNFSPWSSSRNTLAIRPACFT
ncbi:MAG: hypothetical protein O2966_04220 [Proteobacteria bacterium]|nr:hypothetical protein [Pseudomonadota bacterium]